jgi:hypothetical protein
MNFNRNHARSIGWAFVLTVCFAVTMALTVRVNAMKSEVRLAERQLIALKREKIFLETEIETRGNQQKLRVLNDIEFGYQAPTAGQYLGSERQLAAYGKPAAADAPAPVRVAAAVGDTEQLPFAAMVSPLTGKAVAAEARGVSREKPVDAAGLARRLSQAPRREAVEE